MTFFYFSATRSIPSAQKCGGASPSGGVPQSVHSQPQTARKASSHTRTHPKRKAPEKGKQKAQKRTTTRKTHQPNNTAHNGRPNHSTPHPKRATKAEPPAVDVYNTGRPTPPAKSKRKAPRRTGAHDVIFLIGLLEDFTQQNERKKNNTHDQKHFYTSSILSL